MLQKSNLNHQIFDYLKYRLKGKCIDNLISKTYINKQEIDSYLNSDLDLRLSTMVENEIRYNLTKYGTISFKNLDKNYVKYLNCDIFDVNDSYESDINNKNIIIIDDIISTGSTIKLEIEALLKIYKPKSITCLTLLSKLY